MEPLYLPTGYMTAHQVAAQLGITLGGVRRLVHRGRLHHAGGTRAQPWYDRDEVIELLRERRREHAPTPAA